MGRKKQNNRRAKLEPLPQDEIDNRIREIGELIKAARKEVADANDFCYELQISSSSLSKFENQAGNINLSTFLQIYHGLGFDFEAFKKLIKAKPSKSN